MGSLDGLKILDFSTLLPGPYASLMLADMGAEVLKISSPGKYDLLQDYGGRIEDTDVSGCYAWLGRNKKTMFLNLKTPEAKAIVRRLIMDYDIILEQFRPGVMERLGLGYEELREINPRLIYCSLTGYGQTGPMAGAAGHDINYMSRSGIISHAGRAEDGPSLMNFQIADIAAGSLHSVIGILAAVYHREQTGRGQYVDVAMLDGCVPFNSIDGADFLVSGRQPAREGELLNGGCMYDYYETADGGYMSVGCLEPKFWENFCRRLGREDLIAGTVWPKNPVGDVTDNSARDVQATSSVRKVESASSGSDVKASDSARDVKEQLRAIFRTKTRDEWTAVFADADACVQPVLNLEEALLADEQIRAREMVIEVGLPLHKDLKVKQMATAVKLSETPCEYRHAAYPPGHHTREIIDSLGLNYDELAAKGVFD